MRALHPVTRKILKRVPAREIIGGLPEPVFIIVNIDEGYSVVSFPMTNRFFGSGNWQGHDHNINSDSEELE